MESLTSDSARNSTTNKLDDDFLDLPNGGTKATVYVQSFTVSGELTAGFGKSSSGTFHQMGLNWSPKKNQGTITITFKLQGDVQSLSATDPSVSFGAVSNNQQQATLSDRTETISFNVNFTNGSHDPQMVITPT